MAALQPHFQLAMSCYSHGAHRDHGLITQCPQSLPCCGTLTTLKPSPSEGNKSAWNRASAACLVSLHEPSRAPPSNPKGRKASCSCKLFNDDTAGEYTFEDKEEGGGVIGTSWLHYLMDHAGIDTSHAQAARRNYAEEVANLRMAPDGSQCPVDLARAALEIAAEDDALISHSPVPLPVDAYLNRLQAMALEFAGHYLPAQCDNPHNVLEALDLYLFGYQGFRRTKSVHNTVDARVFYLNTVLTTRLGTPVMLALIYSELVKRLQQMGMIDFSVDMELPTNLIDLPRPRVATQDGSKRGDDQTVLLTPELLLVEVLRSLKQLYWPWRENGTVEEGSGFLQAATAASRGIGMTASTSAFDNLFHAPHSSGGAELARARSAQLRLQRGIWTSTNFGDLRRALAASERLVLLGVDEQELRDYGMLLFHAGLYGRSLEYLNAYSTSLANNIVPAALNPLKMKEDVALERLLERLRLILAEQAWLGTSGTQFSSSELPPDPW
ncbi:hypothetical protein M758_9G188100 [Ceratodon purpureus]|nr:hypothetical protein M758_9G188100 [Ceratodon purpureus]